MQKKYVVRLADNERETLLSVVKKLSGSSQKVRRAQVLLKADADGPCWTDRRIAEAFGCRINTVENIRQRPVTEGFEIALNGKPRETPPHEKLFDGEQEAKVIALRLGKPAQRFCQLDSAFARRESRGTEHRRIGESRDRSPDAEKNGMTRRKIQYWVIPPEANSEFVACMENVLDTYALPYDADFPVLCMDEQPVQLLKETRVPIAASRQHPRRVDYEYERNRQHFHVHRTTFRLAHGACSQATHQGRLGC